MKIKIYDPLPDFLLTKFITLTDGSNDISWAELYNMVFFLKSEFPNKKFAECPRLYLDLENNRNGCLFIERESDKLYFVYEE